MSPHLGPAVVAATKAAGLESIPGALVQVGTEPALALRARFGFVDAMLELAREKPGHREPAHSRP